MMGQCTFSTFHIGGVVDKWKAQLLYGGTQTGEKKELTGNLEERERKKEREEEKTAFTIW